MRFSAYVAVADGVRVRYGRTKALPYRCGGTARFSLTYRFADAVRICMPSPVGEGGPFDFHEVECRMVDEELHCEKDTSSVPSGDTFPHWGRLLYRPISAYVPVCRWRADFVVGDGPSWHSQLATPRFVRIESFMAGGPRPSPTGTAVPCGLPPTFRLRIPCGFHKGPIREGAPTEGGWGRERFRGVSVNVASAGVVRIQVGPS